MLQLAEEKPLTKPPQRLTNQILQDPEITQLAKNKSVEALNYRAPAFSGKYNELDSLDREILEVLPRSGGAKEKLDSFLDKQKQIFLVELALQTKQQQIDMLDSDVKRRETTLEQTQNMYEKEV